MDCFAGRRLCFSLSATQDQSPRLNATAHSEAYLEEERDDSSVTFSAHSNTDTAAEHSLSEATSVPDPEPDTTTTTSNMSAEETTPTKPVVPPHWQDGISDATDEPSEVGAFVRTKSSPALLALSEAGFGDNDDVKIVDTTTKSPRDAIRKSGQSGIATNGGDTASTDSKPGRARLGTWATLQRTRGKGARGAHKDSVTQKKYSTLPRSFSSQRSRAPLSTRDLFQSPQVSRRASKESVPHFLQPADEKNEIDLSIGALETLVESFDDPAVITSPTQLKEKLLNVVMLLKKFKMDSSMANALGAYRLRKYLSSITDEKSAFGEADQEVAQWLSEAMFAPSERRRGSHANIAESAAEFFQSNPLGADVLFPRSKRPLPHQRRSSVPLIAEQTSAAAAATAAAAAVTLAAESATASSARQLQSSVSVDALPQLPRSESESSAALAESSSSAQVANLALPSARAQHRAASVIVSPTTPRREDVEAARNLNELAIAEESDNDSGDEQNCVNYEFKLRDPRGSPVPPTVEEVESMILSPSIRRCLKTVNSWDFDLFEFTEHTTQPLLLTSSQIFVRLGLFDKFNISPVHFTNFMYEIERHYRDNLYHNAVHGTDVMQNIFFFLQQPSLSEKVSPLDAMVGLISAAVHDVGHTGTNNQFHIATQSELAIMYNDQSVLENFHVAEAFRIMKMRGYDIFSGLTPEQRKSARDTMIAMVLATDMTQHINILTEMQSALESKAENKSTFDPNNRTDALICLKMAMKCADISNPVKPLHMYEEWAQRITDEFFSQGDMEAERGLPVSAMMDRRKPNLPKAQVGFIDFVIKPLFTCFQKLVPEVSVCLDHLTKNREYYADLVAKANAE
jgi:cAMP-specific phosphodiesterase 4